jgi:RES domain-containing protein
VTVQLWRIASDTVDWTAEDLAGKGAAHKGGRWNAPGEHAIYASTSVSLASWETRAHLGRTGTRLPFNRFLVRIQVPDEVWARRAELPAPLPVGWNAVPEGMVSRNLGSAWIAAHNAALLLVPSVILEEEHNVLINPAHPDARKLKAVKLRRFLYDPRV